MSRSLSSRSHRRAFLRNGIWILGAPTILRGATGVGPLGIFGGTGAQYTPPAGGGGGPTFIFQEYFSDTSVGFDSNNAGNWTNSGGCNPKYGTSPAPLDAHDTQSLRIPGDEYIWRDFTSADEVWFYCLFHATTLRATSDNGIFTIRNAGTTQYAVRVDHDNSDRLQVLCGTVNDRTTSGISASQTYRLWGHYKLGTGANAVADIEWQLDGNARVGSGNNYRQVTTGSSTLAATRIYLHTDGATDVHLIDTVKVTSDGYYSP